MIRQSKTTVKELTAQYRSVLKKCALLNAMVLMSAAFAAPADAATTDTLDHDVLQAAGRQIASGSDLIIDFNGHTYSAFSDPVGSSGTENQLFQLLQDSTVTFQNGTLNVSETPTADFRFLIQNYSNLTLDNMVLDGSGLTYPTQTIAKTPYTLSNNFGSTLIKNSTIIGKEGGFAFDVYYSKGTYGDGVNVTVQDSTINGNIEVDSDGKDTAENVLTKAVLNFKGVNTINGNITNEGTININTTDDAASTITGSIDNSGALNINNTTFTGGEARNGGAIYNAGTTTVNNSEFNKNTATQYGGAIFVASGTLNVNNSTFTENNGGIIGGAISDVFNVLNTLNINEGTTFTGNYATTGGAIGAYNAFNINGTSDNKVTFKDNHTTAVDDGGGAIVLGAHARTTINNAVFDNNYANLGGAIATRPEGVKGDNAVPEQDKDGHWLIISNSEFRNNRADATLVGGTNGSTYTYGGYNFINGDGGAIWNGFDGSTINGEKHENVITNSSFIGNIAANRGGAIFNKGTLNFTGTNIFSGNKANGVLNDIYNDGILNISGNLTLDGGISSASGTGIVNFMDGALLTATLDKTFISGMEVNFKGNNTINMLVENTAEVGDHDFIDTTEPVSGYKNVTINNDLYNMTLNNKGKVNVAVKSGEELLTDTPASLQEANTISALVATAGEGTVKGNAIANQISTLMQTGQKDAAVKLAEEVAPTTSQTVMGVAQSVNSVLANVAGARMAAVGRSGGDAFVGGSVWAQGLMNHTKQNTTDNNAGFSANTAGVSFGIDGKITNDLMIGVGYGYTNTNADSGSRDIDVDGHNIFAYTEYKPNNWYINGMFSYGINKYEETKIANLGAKYDVNTYAANVMTGYDFDSGVTPEIGVRYLLADQKSYNDGLQNISADNNDVLTGVAGFKYKADMKASNWTFAPNLRLAATYDMISDDSIANVSVIGGGNYQITGKSLERLGVEAGIGLETTYKDWTLSINYNGGFRKDFQSHTGMLKAKYNF